MPHRALLMRAMDERGEPHSDSRGNEKRKRERERHRDEGRVRFAFAELRPEGRIHERPEREEHHGPGKGGDRDQLGDHVLLSGPNSMPAR
jgi:hypothetical protein